MSVAQTKAKSAEHTYVDDVEGKVCGAVRTQQRAGRVSCGQWKPLKKYWANPNYEDGHEAVCTECRSKRQAEKKRGAEFVAEIPRERAPVLYNPRPVDLDGASFQVGYHGEAEYVPVGALRAVSRYATEDTLLRAVRDDGLLGPAATILRVLSPRDGKTYETWCLPWSHFSAFCLKFGGPETLTQQQRAQAAIEAAFGRTAQSNQEAARRIDRGATPRVLDTPPSVLFDRDPEQFRALVEAYERAQAAEGERAKTREDAEQDRAQAEREEEQARVLLAAAAERRERAALRESIKIAAHEEAVRNLAAVKAKLDALWMGAPKGAYFYVRVYGMKPDRAMMLIPQVEVGESGETSIAKNDGNAPPPRWEMKRVCETKEEAYAIQEHVRKHVFLWYRAPRRRDHMFDIDGQLFWRFVDYIEAVPVLTLEYVRAFMPLGGAA